MFKLAAKIRDRAQIPHESQYGSASSWTHMIQKFFFFRAFGTRHARSQVFESDGLVFRFLGELAFKLSFSPWARQKKRPRAGVPNEKNVSRSPQRKMGGSMRTCFISITPGSFLESCRRTTRGETAPTSLPSTRARNASMVSICDSSTYRRARRGPRRPNQQRRHCDFAGGVRHGSTSRVSSTPIAVASMMGQLATTQQCTVCIGPPSRRVLSHHPSLFFTRAQAWHSNAIKDRQVSGRGNVVACGS